MEHKSPWLTATEAVAMLECSRPTLRKLVRVGAVRYRGKSCPSLRRYHRGDVERAAGVAPAIPTPA